jgi:maltose alpha-D-glucosyltransferase/alpha-amylase
MDAVLDFTLNNRVFLALTRRQAGPIEDTLAQLDGALPVSGRLNFIRNIDELDLDQLADPEREEVFAEFAPEPRMLLYGRGLRRSWAPMMGDPRRFRMTLSLLMALPGIPLLMQGQELGLGEDLTVEGRGACRPVMQWTGEPGGGFSTRAGSPLILPAQRSGPFDIAHVNAADQDGDPRSNLELTRALVRARSRESGGEGARVVPTSSPAVLGLAGERILTLHNLGPVPRAVSLPDAAAAEVILAEAWADGELGPYGFAWLAR